MAFAFYISKEDKNKQITFGLKNEDEWKYRGSYFIDSVCPLTMFIFFLFLFSTICSIFNIFLHIPFYEKKETTHKISFWWQLLSFSGNINNL